MAALDKIQSRPELRQQLWRNARALYDGLTELGFSICAEASAIIALKMPSEAAAVYMWNALLDAGVYVNLALPPGTPDGSSLLRCSLSAAHTPEQVTRICEIFGACLETLKAWDGAQSAAE